MNRIISNHRLRSGKIRNLIQHADTIIKSGEKSIAHIPILKETPEFCALSYVYNSPSH